MSTKRLTQEQFISRCIEIHGDKYDYSSTTYINSTTKIDIKCNTCNFMWSVSPVNHTHRKSGCPNCKFSNQVGKYTKTTDQVINEIREVHGDDLIYDKVVYINSATKITLGCKVHGYFDKYPNDIKRPNSGCPKCNGSWKKTHEEFVSELPAHIVCIDTYVNAKTPIRFECTLHGICYVHTPNSIQQGINGCVECAKDKTTASKIISGQIPDPKFQTEYEIYRKEVWKFSNKTYKNSNLSNRDKFNHLDHILSIVDGFKYKVPPEVMGSIYNLRIIPAKENQRKSYKSNTTPEALLEKYYR